MLNTTANKITLGRIVLVPVFLILIYLRLTYAALAVFIIACVSDFIDGYIARHYNQVTDFGKFMDPLADKMLVMSAMCFFVENGQMPGWILALVLVREFAVSGLRLVAAGNGTVIAAARSGKIKTLCTMVCLCVMIVFSGIPAINIAGSVIILITTLWSGIEYFLLNYLVFFPGKERGRHENL